MRLPAVLFALLLLVGAGWVRTLAAAASDTSLRLVETLRPEAGDALFGRCLAAARDLLVIGAGETGSGKTGAIYIYRKSSGSWSLEERLRLPDGPKRAKLGRSCATDGERVLAGAPGERTESGSNGAAYVFRRIAGRWVEEARLLPPENRGRQFGRGVAIDGRHAVVGATKDRAGPPPPTGGAFMFRRVDGEWRANGELAVETSHVIERIGFAVVIDRRRLALGSDSRLGLVRMFVRRGGVWVADQTLRREPEEEGERFGGSLALKGKKLVVGYELEAQGADGVPLLLDSGGLWRRELRLVPSDDRQGVTFGLAVAVSRNTLVVGGRDFFDRGASGSAYVFRLEDGRWVETDKLSMPPIKPGRFSSFGEEVAISGRDVIVAEPLANEVRPFGGAVHIFR